MGNNVNPHTFTVVRSPLVMRDPDRSEDEVYSIRLYFHYGEYGDDYDVKDLKQWGVIYGPSETITQMRADITCAGINKMKPPAREYPAIIGLFDHLKEKKDEQD